MVLCDWAMTNRTSPQQIELMVAFMEKHGDLNRAHQNKDRLQLRKLWATLVARLGALTEKGSRPKSLDKWKKTWSDMKNNVKRKAARIAHPELRPPSLQPAGRAAPPLRLSRLDVRVLVVMGLIQRTSSPRKVDGPGAALLAPPLNVQPVVEVLPVDAQTYEELGGADPLTGIKAEEVEFEVERAASDEEFLWPEEPAPRVGAGGPGAGGDALQDVELVEDARGEEPEVDEEGGMGEEPPAVRAVEATALAAEGTAAVRPDTRGHTSTRGAGGARRRRGAGLRRALAALLRAEARRARAEAARDTARAQWERDQRATHKVWQRLCAKGLALLERLADRSESDGGGGPAPAAGARESEAPPGPGAEWEEQPLRPLVLHPARPRP